MLERQPVTRMRVLALEVLTAPQSQEIQYAVKFDAIIPQDCVSIEVSGDTLSLAGLWSDTGIEVFKPEEIASGGHIRLASDSPNTRTGLIITRDGRIYQAQPGMIEKILDNKFIRRLEEDLFTGQELLALRTQTGWDILDPNSGRILPVEYTDPFPKRTTPGGQGRRPIAK